jgi:hypothetical protein
MNGQFRFGQDRRQYVSKYVPSGYSVSINRNLEIHIKLANTN